VGSPSEAIVRLMIRENAVFDWESMNHKKLQPLRLWKVLQA
tara:strand:- start:1001 stop:1123 length:123 start_codon:yes stop_codon:yes gene_type:complete